MEQHLRAAVESAPNGILMVDVQGKIVLVNQEVERLFGYPREELLGRPVEMLIPLRLRADHIRHRAGFMAAHAARAMGAGRELFGRRKDGSEVPVEIGLTPVSTLGGLFILSSIVDITARKQAEAERHRLEEQLRQSQKMEAVGTLAGGIAHDFNNILAAIVGYAELARDIASDRPDVVTNLDDLLQAAMRGRDLVQGILRFSRRQEITRRPADLSQIVGDASRLLRATLPAPIAIRVRIDPSPARALIDATSIHQVLMNLATNAAHAMPQGGVLEISLEPFYVRDSAARAHPDLHEGTYNLLSVRDTGHGMDETVRTRAFEPFFTTKAPGSGSGLGLSMVHGILRDHQGAVLIDSAPGEGTTVRCYFPALEPGVVEEQSVLEMTPHGRGERILYVDDEPALVKVGERRLTRLGYAVTAVADPRMALSAFQADPGAHDLVITDYSMPGLTGLELAGKLRRLRPTIPIILLTGYMDDLPAEQLEAAGVRHAKRKPLTLQELGEVVQAALRQS